MKKKGCMKISAVLLALLIVCTMIAPAAFAEDAGGQGEVQPPAAETVENQEQAPAEQAPAEQPPADDSETVQEVTPETAQEPSQEPTQEPSQEPAQELTSEPTPGPTPVSSPVVYTITLRNKEGGKLTLDPSITAKAVAAGTEVKLTLKLQDGYTLKKLTVKRTDNGAESVPVPASPETPDVYKFTMPSAGVEIIPEYEKAESAEAGAPVNDEKDMIPEEGLDQNGQNEAGTGRDAAAPGPAPGKRKLLGANRDGAASKLITIQKQGYDDALLQLVLSIDGVEIDDQADEGTTVTLKADMAPGYGVMEVSITYGEKYVEYHKVDEKTFQFKMPADDIKIEVVIGKLITIDFGDKDAASEAAASMAAGSSYSVTDSKVTIARFTEGGDSDLAWAWSEANDYVRAGLTLSYITKDYSRLLLIDGHCVGTKPDYTDKADFTGELNNAAGKSYPDGTTVFHVLWEKPVDSIVLAAEEYDCGTTLTYDSAAGSYQEPPAVTLKESKAGSGQDVVEKNIDTAWDISGTAGTVVLKGVEPYSAKAKLTAKFGYYISENTTIEVNGEEVPFDPDTCEVTVPVSVKHNEWKAPEYQLAEAGDSFNVKASRNCKTENCDAVETETVSTTSAIKQKATCTDSLITTYTSAKFENPAFTEYSEDVTGEIDPEAHNWAAEATYKWADDNKTVSAVYLCNNNSSHEQVIDTAKVTAAVSTPATCTEKGKTTYTPDAFSNKDLKTVPPKTLEDIPINADAHKWVPDYVWAEDNSTVTATAVCEHNEAHTLGPVTVKTTSEITVTPSPDKKGEKVFTAVFEDKPFTTQTKTEALVMYTCTEGSGGTWTKGSNATQNFTFRRNFNDNETFERFKSLRVDGKTLADNQYKIESGSLKVYLQPAYLETLSAGSHTLTAQFSDGQAAAKFEIARQSSNKNSSGGTTGRPTVTPTGRPTATPTGGTTGRASVTAGAAARTGDTSHMALWMVLLILAAAGCGIGIYFKKESR